MSWRQDAACAGQPVDVFFSVDTNDAKAICDSCDVVIECRGYAIATRTSFGIWGGQTHEERKAWAKTRDTTEEHREYLTATSW